MLRGLAALLLATLAGTAYADEAPAESLGAAHAHQFAADPWLVVASVGAGIEPHDRGDVASFSSASEPVAFALAGEALWRGLVGGGLGLYASEGGPVLLAADNNNARPPGFADRISFVAALAVRPLAPLAWRRGDDYVGRLLGGVGVELGIAAEIARTSLDLGAAPGLHALLFADVPLVGGGAVGGLSLRLAARLLVTSEQDFSPDPVTSKPQVVSDATAVQLFAGLTYTL